MVQKRLKIIPDLINIKHCKYEIRCMIIEILIIIKLD